MTNQLSKSEAEQRLLSKEAIKLPPKERLELLLKADSYPIVHTCTAAKRQIEEMIDFYNLCCLMLVQYFPNKEADTNFLMLSFIASQENNSIVNGKLAEAFRLLKGYEELENRITSIHRLFYQYQYSFPELYQTYNLEEIAMVHISDTIRETRLLMSDDSAMIERTLRRWDLLS